MPEGGLRVLPDLMCWSTWLLDKPWKNVHYSDMDNLVNVINKTRHIKIHCKCCLMSNIELVVSFHVSFKFQTWNGKDPNVIISKRRTP